MKRRLQGIVRIATAFLFLCVVDAGLFAGGTRETPTKVVLTAPIAYISPESSIAERRTLSLGDIRLQIDKNGVIKKYEFAVYDKTGTAIYMSSKENLQGRGFLGDVFNVGEIPSVSLPSKIEWGATKTDGTRVADGEYSYQLTATDNWGFSASSAPLTVVVDTRPPLIQTIAARQNVISPNADGRNDTLVIRHLTSPAAEWTEEIVDSAMKVLWSKKTAATGDSEAGDIQMPETTEWTGVMTDTSTNDRIAEGNYVYRLTGVDRAGNLVQSSLPFRVSYSGGEIGLSIEGGIESFNPNKALVLVPELSDTAGLLSWKLEIQDSQGVVWRRYAGQGQPVNRIEFDGTGNARDPEAQGQRLKDGMYNATFVQTYDSGISVSSPAVSIQIDTIGPRAQMKMRSSPKEMQVGQPIWFGGAQRSTVHFSATTERGPDWYVEFLPADGKNQKAYRNSLSEFIKNAGYNETTPTSTDAMSKIEDFDWQGYIPIGSEILDFNPSNGAMTNPSRSDTAIPLPDGQWYARLSAKDSAGNEGRSTALILVRSSKTHSGEQLELSAALIRPGLSEGPNELGIAIPGIISGEIESFTLTTSSDTGEQVFAKTFNPDQKILWQGQRSNGLPAPDGFYTPQVVVSYLNGDSSTISGQKVEIQGKQPRANVSASNLDTVPSIVVRNNLLYEAGNRKEAEVVFAISNFEKTADEDLWSLNVIDNTGAIVWSKSKNANEAPPSVADGAVAIVWDGTDSNGKPIQSANEFVVELVIQNQEGQSKGKISTAFITGIPFVKLGDKLRIALPDVIFPGNDSNPMAGTSAQRESNRRVLRQLGAVLARLPNYKITVEGYATYTDGFTTESMTREQSEELIPLSAERSQRVREALYLLNVAWDRLDPLARGGVDPVAPYDDLQNRWKNRRVVFTLTKEGL